METASADSMPEGVERQGIGTPATRAATIEKLVQKGFLERKGTKKTKVLGRQTISFSFFPGQPVTKGNGILISYEHHRFVIFT